MAKKLPLRTRAVGTNRLIREANAGKRSRDVPKGLAEAATGKNSAYNGKPSVSLGTVGRVLKEEMDGKGMMLVERQRKPAKRNSGEEFNR